MTSDNKNSYFKVLLKVPQGEEKFGIETITRKLEDVMEPVFGRMGATEQTFTIYKIDTVLFLFQTKQRKRIGLLRTLVKKHVSDDHYIGEPRISAVSKRDFHTDYKRYRNNKSITVKGEHVDEYDGKDIRVYKEKDNWYKWQRKFYDMIFDEKNMVREANDREIVFIEDFEGCGGKSTFLKYIYLQNTLNVGLIQTGTTGQIKSLICNMGPKKLYLVDLPRTPGSEGLNDLISTLEILKNGLVQRNFFGDGNILCMAPPWIVIVGNIMPLGNWTPDRWVVFTLDKKTRDWTTKNSSEKTCLR